MDRNLWRAFGALSTSGTRELVFSLPSLVPCPFHSFIHPLIRICICVANIQIQHQHKYDPYHTCLYLQITENMYFQLCLPVFTETIRVVN